MPAVFFARDRSVENGARHYIIYRSYVYGENEECIWSYGAKTDLETERCIEANRRKLPQFLKTDRISLPHGLVED